MNKQDKKRFSCKMIGKMTSVKITGVKKGLLNSVKICFDGKVKRKDLEQLRKCLRENKIKFLPGENCFVIK